MSTDVWQVADLDLAGYLARTGAPARPPTAELLAELHEAHVRAFTFDNVDVVMGHHFTSTFPGSHITTGLMVTQHLPGRHVTVTRDTLTVRVAGGCTEHRPLRDGELGWWLTELGARLSADELDGVLEWDRRRRNP